jgi:hypothetical protein
MQSRLKINKVYFVFPSGVPHFGHFREDMRKPGLGGISVLHVGQRPATFGFFPEPICASANCFVDCAKLPTALVGFCPFLCGMLGSCERLIFVFAIDYIII